MVAGQPIVVSPSDTVSVTVALPGSVQVKVGVGDVALLSVPLDAVHTYCRAEGPARRSWAGPFIAPVPPPKTSGGLAPIPSIVGQMFSPPLTSAEPRRGASWQVRDTMTELVWPAATAKGALPLQLVSPDVEVA